ncbi:MAG: C40 family peptidase, partial [Paracoccaceae bacterium]
FVQDIAMGYVGYMARAALGPWGGAVTHRVRVRRTLVYGAPDMKTPPLMALPFGAQITMAEPSAPFSRTAQGTYVVSDHLSPLDIHETDPVAVAHGFLDAPYLWGGNSPDGVDCSGLVQAGLSACGLPCPGDSDQQQAALGPRLPPQTPKQRGDLLFWRGHVAWVVDAQTLLHANAHHMAVAHEPIETAILRIAAQGDGPMTAHIRPEVPR